MHRGEPQGLCTAEISKRIHSAPLHSANKSEMRRENGALATKRGGAGRVGRSRPGRGERGPRGAERGELAGPARERAGWEGLWTPKADLGRLEKFGDKRSGGRGEVGGVWGNTEVEIWIMGLYWTDGEEGQEAEAGGV